MKSFVTFAATVCLVSMTAHAQTSDVGITRAKEKLKSALKDQAAKPPAPSRPGQLRWRDGYIDAGKFVKATWRTFEADNGAVLAVDVKSIAYFSSGQGAQAVAYVAEGETFDPNRMRSFTFDCKGRFSVTSAAGQSSMSFAPPRSVARQISDVVCAGAPGVCDSARKAGVPCN